MIDNLDQVERLMDRLETALPLPARATPAMLATLHKRSSDISRSPRCVVKGLHYLGDEGGIMCEVSFLESDDKRVVITSITHLDFDPRLHLTREIAAYQKHRTKRLRRQHALEAAMVPYSY